MPEQTPKLGIKKPLGNETVSRAAFNENWDIIDAQAQKNIAQGATAPASPTEGELWIDTCTSPNALKRYTAGNWVKIGAVTPGDLGAVANAGGAPSIQAGMDAAKPAPGTAGRLYVATDTQIIYRDTGTAWAKVGVVKWGDIEGKPSSFPPSTHTHPGSDITSKVDSAAAADVVPWDGVSGKPSTFPPSAHKSTHAAGGSDELTPSDIGAAPSSHTHTRSQITDFVHKSTHARGGSDPITPADIGAVNKAGDTMTGKLTAPSYGSLDTRSTPTAPGDYGEEMRLQFKYLSAIGLSGIASGEYCQLMGYRAGRDDSGGCAHELAFTDGGDIYYRNGTEAAGWGSWQKLWHAGNDGAGSGMDADTVDGKHASDLENVPEGATIYGKVGLWVPTEKAFGVISQFVSPADGPTGLTWDGTYLWLADLSADKIYKLNTSGTIISSFASPSYSPAGLAWDGTRSRLYNADSDADQIYVLNTSGTIISSFASPSYSPTGLTWDGTYLWNADSGKDLIYKMSATGYLYSSFASPSVYPYGLAWDGAYLWHSDINSTGNIYKLNTSGYVYGQFSPPDYSNPRDLAWDGAHLWNASGNNNVYKLLLCSYSLMAV